MGLLERMRPAEPEPTAGRPRGLLAECSPCHAGAVGSSLVETSAWSADRAS